MNKEIESHISFSLAASESQSLQLFTGHQLKCSVIGAYDKTKVPISATCNCRGTPTPDSKTFRLNR